MRVSLNALLLAQPHTGSGQYTQHLMGNLRGIDLDVAQPKGRGNLAKLEWEQWGWPRQAARSGADLLHSPYFALPVRRSCPAVVTIHDVIPMVLPAYAGTPLVRAYTWLQALACRSAEAIVVDSEYSRRDVVRLLHVPESRVHVVYLGVEEKLTPDRSGPSPMDRPYVFYIGGWDVRKNVPALIEAFGRIAEQFPELVLAIAGQPASGSRMFPDLRRLADHLGERVRFLGRVSDHQKLQLYRHAELFVFPSLYEGFGLDPLEALACGCPVVCSNAASLPEVVGDAAVLVDARDPAVLAQAMAATLRDPEPLRQRGPLQAAKFRWQRTGEQTAEIYRMVLS